MVALVRSQRRDPGSIPGGSTIHTFRVRSSMAEHRGGSAEDGGSIPPASSSFCSKNQRTRARAQTGNRVQTVRFRPLPDLFAQRISAHARARRLGIVFRRMGMVLHVYTLPRAKAASLNLHLGTAHRTLCKPHFEGRVLARRRWRRQPNTNASLACGASNPHLKQQGITLALC